MGRPMTENTKNPNTKSLRRYSAVSQVLQLTEEGLPLSHALNLCARRNYDGHHYGASTLEKWYYRYRHLGYEGLICRVKIAANPRPFR
ncbi:MAG: hypothetical protein O3C43_18940 [Verrucomicrobia bacterium]|nr:hypothetical protein [Verrucomicrobiota bacterium]